VTEDRPLVTVVVPTYQREALLPATLDSLVALEYSPVEIIVVDDGSTDGTPALLAGYAARHPNLRVLRHDNVGQAASVNRGIAEASGAYLIVVNSDDPQPPGMLGPLVGHLEAHPEVVLVYPDWEMIDETGLPLAVVRPPDFDRVAMVAWSECLPGPGSLVRRSAVDAAGGWDPTLRTCPDWEWYLRLSLHGPFARVPQVLARWRSHSASITMAERSEAAARERVMVVERFFAREDLPEAVRAVRGEAMRNTYILAAAIVTTELPGPGARFTVTDRLGADRLTAEASREPATMAPAERVLWLETLLAERAATTDWLHAEVAQRDETIAWLHREVADRDRTVTWLHSEVADRDRTIGELRGGATRP